MTGLKPAMHGRDHLPEGADPIPFPTLGLFPGEAFTTTGNQALLTDGYLEWQYYSGSFIIDLTDPATPTPYDDGIYAVNVTVASYSVSSGAISHFGLVLTVGTLVVVGYSTAGQGGVDGPYVCSLSKTYFIAAGDPITAYINQVGSGSHTFAIALGTSIQRLA